MIRKLHNNVGDVYGLSNLAAIANAAGVNLKFSE